MLAVRFHHRPIRYLWTRWASRRRPRIALGPLGCLTLDNVEAPPLPGADWVRIETSLSGICGSDLAAVTAHDSFTLEPFAAFPFTFGHENVGRIAEIGANVTGWEPGDRVVVDPMLACRQRGLDPVCSACARGDYGVCRRTDQGVPGPGLMIGYCPSTGGGWSHSFVAHQNQLHRVDDLADELAVLTDPLASALRPVLLQPPRKDDYVLVLGAGSIGLLTILALRFTGWPGPIAVFGRYPFQLDMAKRCGANLVFRRRSELYRWAETLPDARGYKPSLAPRFVEGGPSLIFDTVGSTGSARDAFALARESGRIVMVGGAAHISADWTRLVVRQLTLTGVIAYGTVPVAGEQRDIYEVALQLLRTNDFDDLKLVTHVFPLEDYRAALSAALDKNGNHSVKVAFRPSV